MPNRTVTLKAVLIEFDILKIWQNDFFLLNHSDFDARGPSSGDE